MKHPRAVLFLFVTLLLTFAINLAGADSNPPVIPPTSHAYGKSYEEWSAAWLQWAMSIPAASNPILDNTGAYSSVGQSGKVWFLAGTTGSGAVPPVVRTITIPSGTPLFFPIVNYFWVNTPEYGDPNWSPAQEANARSILADIVDTATGFSLKIDGHSIKNLYDFRFQSTVAKCTIPPLAADNLFGADLVNNPYYCVADGYWVMVHPLPVGSHEIHFTGGFTAFPPFSLDVTYKITVKPGRKEVEVPLHPR